MFVHHASLEFPQFYFFGDKILEGRTHRLQDRKVYWAIWSTGNYGTVRNISSDLPAEVYCSQYLEVIRLRFTS